MSVSRFAVITMIALSLCGASFAAQIAAPKSETILTVTGKIANGNDGSAAHFDRAMLEAIGTETIRTKTPWNEDVAEFEGVPMKALLAYVGAEGSEVIATALNDYQSIIPVSDFDEYNVILAMKRDGQPMPIRDKGPLFIVYPFDSDPSLENEQYYSRSVWQVKALEIR